VIIARAECDYRFARRTSATSWTCASNVAAIGPIELVRWSTRYRAGAAGRASRRVREDPFMVGYDYAVSQTVELAGHRRASSSSEVKRLRFPGESDTLARPQSRADDRVGKTTPTCSPPRGRFPPRSSTPGGRRRAALARAPLPRSAAARLDAGPGSRHGHRDPRRRGGGDRRRAHPDGDRSASSPWPDEDAQYHVPWQTLGDGDLVRVGGRLAGRRSTRQEHSPRPSRVLATSRKRDHLYRRSRGAGQQRDDSLEPRRATLGQLPRVARGACLSLEAAAGLLPAHGPVDRRGRRAILSGYLAHRRQPRAAGDRCAPAPGQLPACRPSPNPSMMVLAPALMPAAQENVARRTSKTEDRRGASPTNTADGQLS